MPSQQIEKRQSFSPPTFAVTLTYTTMCGEPDVWQEPRIYCVDETPGLGFRPFPAQANVVQTSPGVYTTACTFVEPGRLMADSEQCITLYPLLRNVCAFSDMISAPGTIAGTLCFPLSLKADLAELYLPCVEIVSKLADFCAVLSWIDALGRGSGLENLLCGPIPTVTSMSVAIGGNSWYSPIYTLATQKSNAAHDLAFTTPNTAPPGAKCLPCSSSGSQVLYTPWEEVYNGPLFMGDDWSCNLDYAGAIPGVSGFGGAQSFCQGVAEDNCGC
jgi:hypothetical protein